MEHALTVLEYLNNVHDCSALPDIAANSHMHEHELWPTIDGLRERALIEVVRGAQASACFRITDLGRHQLSHTRA
ncbi:MAG TPA: hypothetical protein VHL57_05545 [Flavobacteriales bacterium]|nr:hypothetical protein [Flavobacteriales bacterium]